MTEVIQFHNLAHIFLSLIGAVLLLAIYYNIRNRFIRILKEDENQKRVDQGLLFLSSAMFIWVLSGTLAYFSIKYDFNQTFIYDVCFNLFSIFNNMFILLALTYFHSSPTFIYKNEKNVKIIVIVIISITLLTLVTSYLFSDIVYNNIRLTSLPDLLLSAFLCYILGISLFKTFLHRGLKVVAYISIIVILLIFRSQLPATFLDLNDTFANNLINIIAKTSLISLFLVLATSWVIQLANTPKVDEMRMQFTDWSLLKLNIPSKNIHVSHIDFGSKTTQFKNLLKMALRRKYGDSEDQCILVGSYGEIKNQTYLSRIIENINEILDLKDDQQLERKDLFTFLGDGKYRLRMLPDHIEIEETLFYEFVNNPENQAYKTLCN